MELPMAKRWYVVQVSIGHEQDVINSLPQGFSSFFPRYRQHVKNANKVVSRIVPLFSPYIFVRFCVKKDAWSSVCQIKHVHTILGLSTGLPAPLPKGCVEALKASASRKGIVEFEQKKDVAKSYKSGEKLEIIDGSFKGHLVTCEKTVKNQVVAVMSLLQREIRVILPLVQVTAAPPEIRI
jgi:transcriptional antiterminator RfaH